MKYTEASLGRVFILRLEHGDVIPKVIEEFALNQSLEAATVFFLGGAEKESQVITGPEDGTAKKIVADVSPLSRVSEAVGVGTIFLNEKRVPTLHLHSAFGNREGTTTGCTRKGVTIWHIGEVIILELLNHSAHRRLNPDMGFELLEV